MQTGSAGINNSMDKLDTVMKNIIRADKVLLESYEKLLPHIDDLREYINKCDESDEEKIYEMLKEIKGVLSESAENDIELNLFSECVLFLKYELLQDTSKKTEYQAYTVRDPQKGAKIVYVKNSYSDYSYNVFSSHLNRAVVSYANDFSSACEEVYYSRAEYCILPVSSSKEGILQSFRNMIDKYDLKTVLKTNCPVGDDYTEFALLSKNAEVIEMPGDQFIEINTTIPEDNTLGKCLRMIERHAVEIIRIDSVPLKYADNKFSYNILMKNKNKNIGEIIKRLDLYYPGYQLNGIYTYVI